ncbi:uncharacterized protein CCOS01_13913, partial [Colletotrichum costaricense]
LTKFVYFILYKKLNTIKNLVYIFIKVIFSNYSLLKEIIFNRD